MTVSDPSSARLAALLSSASVEISSRGHQVAELREHFAAGTDVTITFLPGDNYRHNVETAAALRRAGFNPVPHIAAREMASREALDDFLARARGEADVSRILLIAGDVATTRGPFKSTRDVCASGLIEAHGIASVSVAGHPEGHPFLELPDAHERAGRLARLGTADRKRVSMSSRNSASRARRSCNGSLNSIAPASIFPLSSALPVRPRRRH